MHQKRRRPLLSRPRAQDDWYAALEGRRVRRAGKSWRVEVIGIHKAGSTVWLQLRLVGHPTKELLVRVPPRTSAQVALHMLVDALTHEQGEYRIPTLHEAA